MKNIEEALEFHKIKEQLVALAYTDRAKKELQEMEPILAERELRAKLRETTEAKILLEKAGNPPLTSLGGLMTYLDVAEKGGCLSAEELEEIAMALVAIRRLKDYLCRGKQYDVSIAYFEENLTEMEDIREAIHLAIRNGKVDDQASKVLQKIRSEIQLNETKMRDKADQILRANKTYMSDNYTTTKNGRICLPVKKEYKAKINGNVVDQSSTGATVFIEPKQVMSYREKLDFDRIEEENEAIRILYGLTVLLADVAEIMSENTRTIERLDVMFAKAKLSMDLEAVEPKINTERRIQIVEGRHPLMDRKVNVPLDIMLGGETQGIIITGPNTGGKTVALKTVALNNMMAQCGLHVTCKQADLCMNSSYLCDIGDGQNLTENLSTFSAHITNVLGILKMVSAESLVIMDELGSGTDPTEGMGIAIAVLDELKRSGALFLVTTHYPEVKEYAENVDGVVNAKMTFDQDTLQPLYRLVIGEAGESCAFHIARKLGMPDHMLKRAERAAYKSEEVDTNQLQMNFEKSTGPKIQKAVKKPRNLQKARVFSRGDSVMIMPDQKIGIVCEEVNDKGVLRIQMQSKKIYINYKRVKLLVAAEHLYPDDYDFSIVFDSVAERKMHHQMSRKYEEGQIIEIDEEK